MINFDSAIEEKIKEHNPNWAQIPDHPYRILIIRGSGWGKQIVDHKLSNFAIELKNFEKGTKTLE